jgi:predicted phage terminase large subunit-like protein
MDYNKRLLQAVLRHDFSSFIHKCFVTINPGIDYASNWHIDLIADHLEEVRKGKVKRLIINMPPRALKSVCVSVAWPAWLLGHNPRCRIIVASYSQVLSIKHSLDCKIIIESDWYKELFPNTVINRMHNLKSKFMTTELGFRFATSVGGSVTGEGGDYLIIDDPHNPTNIHSKKMRSKVIDWYEQTFATRLNDKKKGAIILVMQRLHEEDLCGHLLGSSKNWRHLKLPIINNEEFKFKIADKEFYIKPNTMLHEGRDDIESLRQIEEELVTYNFSAQYMQEPISNLSSLLKQEDIHYYDHLEEFDYIVQSWDTAIKITAKSDFSVCTTWAIKQKKYYLISMLRSRFEYSDLKSAIISQAKKFNPKFIIIEDKASGQSLNQDLSLETNLIIKKYNPAKDKITRFAATIPHFQSGRVLLPENALWMNVFLQELMSFPNGKNDDIVDALSQFIDVMKNSKNTEVRIRTI